MRDRMNIFEEAADGAPAAAQGGEVEHFCRAELLPGECLHCAGQQRPTVTINTWAGAKKVEVEVLGKTAKRTRVRFLAACAMGPIGSVHLVSHDAVSWPATRGQVAARGAGGGR